jgi:hypothetical protein
VRCRPQSTWWEGRRPVRDAEVTGSNPARLTFALFRGPVIVHTCRGMSPFPAYCSFDWRVPADRLPGCGDDRRFRCLSTRWIRCPVVSSVRRADAGDEDRLPLGSQ